jgi:TPR repeat protein
MPGFRYPTHGLRVALAAAAFVCALALPVTPVPAQVTPPPGARSPLSPPETDRSQAAAFQRGYDAYYRGQYERAAAIWRQLADQGHIKSINNLATMYVQGKGVPRDYARAHALFRRAAARNDARAAYNLGIAHEFGRGVPVDDRQALGWYRKASDRGLVEATNAAAWLLATSKDPGLRDGREAVRLAQLALRKSTTSVNLATMAAAQAESGDFGGAIASIDQAIAVRKREIDAAGLVASGRDANALLRNAGRAESLEKLLARREDYLNRRPTRD